MPVLPTLVTHILSTFGTRQLFGPKQGALHSARATRSGTEACIEVHHILFKSAQFLEKVSISGVNQGLNFGKVNCALASIVWADNLIEFVFIDVGFEVIKNAIRTESVLARLEYKCLISWPRAVFIDLVFVANFTINKGGW